MFQLSSRATHNNWLRNLNRKMAKLIVPKIESKPKTNTTRAYKQSEIKL